MKIDTVFIDEILTGILVESKIVEDKIVVSKIEVLTTEELKIVEVTISMTDDTNSLVEEEGGYNSMDKKEGGYSSVDEVVATFVIDTLSCEGAKSDWTFDVSMVVVTMKLAKAIFELDVATDLTRECGNEEINFVATLTRSVSSSSCLASLVASSSLSSSTSSLSK